MKRVNFQISLIPPIFSGKVFKRKASMKIRGFSFSPQNPAQKSAGISFADVSVYQMEKCL